MRGFAPSFLLTILDFSGCSESRHFYSFSKFCGFYCLNWYIFKKSTVFLAKIFNFKFSILRVHRNSPGVMLVTVTIGTAEIQMQQMQTKRSTFRAVKQSALN